MESLGLENSQNTKVKLLKAITEPFTHYVIKVDTSIIEKKAQNLIDPDTSLIKIYCGKGNDTDTKCEFYLSTCIISINCLFVVVGYLLNFFGDHIENIEFFNSSKTCFYFDWRPLFDGVVFSRH